MRHTALITSPRTMRPPPPPPFRFPFASLLFEEWFVAPFPPLNAKGLPSKLPNLLSMGEASTDSIGPMTSAPSIYSHLFLRLLPVSLLLLPHEPHWENVFKARKKEGSSTNSKTFVFWREIKILWKQKHKNKTTKKTNNNPQPKKTSFSTRYKEWWYFSTKRRRIFWLGDWFKTRTTPSKKQTQTKLQKRSRKKISQCNTK